MNYVSLHLSCYYFSLMFLWCLHNLPHWQPRDYGISFHNLCTIVMNMAWFLLVVVVVNYYKTPLTFYKVT